jgi:hypothetical protein
MATNRHIRRRALRGIVVVLFITSALFATAHRNVFVPARSAVEVEHEEYEEHEGRAPTKAELEPSVEGAFTRESYRPGTAARLVIVNAARGITLQIFRVGLERGRTRGNNEMQGVPVTKRAPLGSSLGRRVVRVAVGNWPNGLYFARLEARDGRVGFAPFFVRPERLGHHRVAVVLPTFTWQAYNLRDNDGDGKGDSWYGSWKVRTARLGRPYLNRGVPFNFRRYDLPFIHWLERTGRGVDYLADTDLAAAPSAGALARAYDLIVFPGHHEYVTTREYNLIEAYRNLGGNLMFLSANNFFWQIVKRGNVIEKTKQWRDLGRPEAALIGVQYRGNDDGSKRGAWIVRSTSAAGWVFSGTGLRPGSRFSEGGIEIDKTSAASPEGIEVIAEIPNLFGHGFTGQMTHYETPAGAKVFAAGAFSLARSIHEPRVAHVVANVWARLTSDAGRDAQSG